MADDQTARLARLGGDALQEQKSRNKSSSAKTLAAVAAASLETARFRIAIRLSASLNVGLSHPNFRGRSISNQIHVRVSTEREL